MKIIFFEKPGCIGNARQKAVLTVGGHSLETKDLLSHPFTREELRSYFGSRPVSEWFNRSAPRVKSGEVRPGCLSPDEALDMMLGEPLLIRRPLIEVNGIRMAGFDLPSIERAAGALPRTERLNAMRRQDLEDCPGARTGYRCPDANAASAADSSVDTSTDLAEAQPDQT